MIGWLLCVAAFVLTWVALDCLELVFGRPVAIALALVFVGFCAAALVLA